MVTYSVKNFSTHMADQQLLHDAVIGLRYIKYRYAMLIHTYRR